MRTSKHRSARLAGPGLAAAITVLLLLAGCGQDDKAPARAGNEPPPPTPSLPRGSDPVELDPTEFTAGSDHPYFPLEPGRQWTFRETDESGASVTVVVTVTNQTRKIANGVEARVVRDTVTEDGALIEDTLDWYAQDADGNVWYLGEDTAEFEGGKLTTREGSFEAGVDGALPGVIMPADPAAGMQYRQEYYEGEAEDNGEIVATGHQVDVAQGHFDDVVLTADTITIEPEVLEYKLYAPGVGLVMALGISGGGGREELVSTRTVSEATAEAAGTTPLGKPYS
jgi:hypothetical protein